MNHNITVLVVDDETPARDKLIRFISSCSPNASVIQAEDGEQAIDILSSEKVNIMFLDIQMPNISGLEVVRIIGPENLPATIFATAYDEYAVEAFNVEAVDYLLKPFDYTRFKKAFDRALERSSELSDTGSGLNKVIQEYPFNRPMDRIMVKNGNTMVIIKVSDIQYLMADEKYIHIQVSGKNFLIRSSLSSLMERLNTPNIVRIHRSYAINLDYVNRIEPLSHGDLLVIMADDKRLTVSRRYKDQLPVRY